MGIPIRQSRFQSAAQKLLLLLGSTLLALGVAEALFRMFDVRGYHEPRKERDEHLALLPEADRVPGVSAQYRPYAEFAHVYDSTPHGVSRSTSHWSRGTQIRGVRF